MSEKRRYSDNEKAVALAALDANDGNVARTARQIGVPHKTLDEWARGRNQHPVVADMRQEKKADLAIVLEAVALQLVDAIPDKITSANLQQVATALGIAIDKMQLLKGKPTNITDDAAITDNDRARRIKELLARGSVSESSEPEQGGSA